ncbi:GntR family transcriptional regulator [Pelomicrobium methylotrophicum]|uniref:GntR family transcriptional regulator n=1 Tax=Pelomicrobium methylotrophicum TaxID=2602750 RepID=A0A5C7EP81_9PROT|nr:GntR family transcriptional regulator [Pelomicrobium methylotrophicum]TXF13147.1 GntR family transcriptional regulator [Pelomicrobium methylotrophicum]
MENAVVSRGFGQAPLYKIVKSRLLEGLTAGEWTTGEALPSEAKLAARFDVSIGTVRKAIDELVAEKILVRHQGKGTFVAVHNKDRTLYYFFHLVGPDGVKEFPTSELLSFGKAKAEAAVAEQLRIARGAPVFRFRNLLKLQGRPVILDHITIPQALFPDLDEEALRKRESTIYALYQARYGINVIRAQERLRARPCDAEAAKILGLASGAPILEIHRVAYTYNDVPVEVRLSTANTEHHDYLNDLGKGQAR